MPVPFEGGCRCGAVRYVCNSEPAMMAHCHCRDCQYSSGGPYATLVIVPEDSLEITGTVKDFSLTADSGKDVTRKFCPECGTPVFSKPEVLEGMMVIKAPSMDDPSWIEPAFHMFTDSDQPWTEVSGEIPSFGKGPG